MFLKITNRNSNIIKDAKTFAVLFKGMVSASREADSNSFCQCGMAGLSGRLGLSGTSSIELRVGRKPECELFFAVKFTVIDLGQILIVVNSLEDMQVGLRDINDFVRP